MSRIRDRALAGLKKPSTADEIRDAKVAAARSRIQLRKYEAVADGLTEVTDRQRRVIENNHLAPSFAAAMGRRSA